MKPLAAITNPEVQYPHCCPSWLTKAAETGCRLFPVARPSMVSIFLPCASMARTLQLYTVLPARMTVTGSAGAAIADSFRAGQVQIIAHGVEQRHARLDRHIDGFSVDRERDRDRPGSSHIGWGRSCRRFSFQQACSYRAAAKAHPRMNPRRGKPGGIFPELTHHLPFVNSCCLCWTSQEAKSSQLK